MANYVSMTALDGTSVGINPEEVASLSPVPTSLLPTGVVAGTYVQSEDGSRVAVQGTVAATITALGSAGSARIVLDGATGAVISATTGTTSVRNGAGDYTITHPAITGAKITLVGADDGAAAMIATAVDVDPTHVNVLTFDAAGAANDAVQLGVTISAV